MKIKGPFSKEEGLAGEEMPEMLEGGVWQRCKEWCGSFGKHVAEVWSILGILAIAGVIWWTLGVYGILPMGDFPSVLGVLGPKWQAVFLTNNQVYFGRLENYNREYTVLKNVYYLQTQQAGQAFENLNLVKLGSEIHGPEDTIFIPKKQILFWENLRSDSRVVGAIESAGR